MRGTDKMVPRVFGEGENTLKCIGASFSTRPTPYRPPHALNGVGYRFTAE